MPPLPGANNPPSAIVQNAPQNGEKSLPSPPNRFQRLRAITFIPAKADTRWAPWKPFTLSVPFLTGFLSINIILILAVELLCQKSEQDNGVYFWQDESGLQSTYAAILFNYLPTTIMVVYGLLWATIDLNVKRLEPFFQLSRPSAVDARDSLLLEYPFEYLALVPLQALYRKHWAVFFSGTALVIIFWVLTPLQSAVFTTDQITRISPAIFSQSKILGDSTYQKKSLGDNLFATAYGAAWLGMNPAPFTTKSEAFIPFDIQQHSSKISTTETWTSETEVYSSKLVCKEGKSAGVGIARAWLNHTAAEVWKNRTGVVNGSGCYRNISFSASATTTAGAGMILNAFPTWKVPSGMSNGVPIDDQGGDCSDVDLIFLWAKNLELGNDVRNTRYNATSLFCKTEYRNSSAQVTIDPSTKEVVQSTKLTGDWTPLHNETFNGTFFLDLILKGQNTDPSFIIKDPSGPPLVSLPTRVSETPLSQASSMAIAMNITGSDFKFDDYANKTALFHLFGDAHALLFAIAMSQSMHTPKGFQSTGVAGERHIIGEAVIVVPTLARILEGFLATVAVLCCLLLITNARRSSHLHSDPDSIAVKMALVSESTRLLSDFDGLDQCQDIEKHLPSNTQYRLGEWHDSGPSYRLDRDGIINTKTPQNIPAPKYTRPVELRLYSGAAFLLFLTALLVLFSFLYHSAQKNNGLPRLVNNPIGFSIIFSYAPTIAATFIEPYWVLITRNLCVYQPWITLNQGSASPESLTLKYTSIPPALVFPRAIRAKHFFLASVALIALMANFLTIALSGMFTSETRQFSSPHNYTQPYIPQITGLPSLTNEERWVVTTKTIIDDALLLPWVSPDYGYYFLPFESSSQNGTANTRGFGTVLDCHPLDDPILEVQSSTTRPNSTMPVYSCFRTANLNFTMPAWNDRNARRCGRKINQDFAGERAAGEPNENRCTWWNDPESIGLGQEEPATAEFSTRYDYKYSDYFESGRGSPFSNTTNEICDGVFTMGWARANFVAVNSTEEFLPGTKIPTTWIEWDMAPKSFKSIEFVCQQSFTTALFDVTVDDNGRVQQYNRTSELETDIRPYLELSGTSRDIDNFTDYVDGITQMQFSLEKRLEIHNNKTNHYIERSYLLGLLDKLSGSDSFSNSSAQLPDFATAANSLEKAYKLLFAVTLGLYSKTIFELNADKTATIMGIQPRAERRVLLDPNMFVIAMVVLSSNIVIGFVVYFRRPPKFLPQLPTTLACEIALFYGSQALEDLRGTERMSTATRRTHLANKGQRYGYGWYAGMDGKLRKGVERQTLLLKDGDRRLVQGSI